MAHIFAHTHTPYTPIHHTPIHSYPNQLPLSNRALNTFNKVFIQAIEYQYIPCSGWFFYAGLMGIFLSCTSRRAVAESCRGEPLKESSNFCNVLGHQLYSTIATFLLTGYTPFAYSCCWEDDTHLRFIDPHYGKRTHRCANLDEVWEERVPCSVHIAHFLAHH